MWVVLSSSVLVLSRYRNSQIVQSVKNANDGPNAGFATVVEKAECGLCGAGAEEVALLMTYITRIKPKGSH